MGLRDGSVRLTVNLGSGEASIDLRPEPAGSTLADDRWHYVVVKRDWKTVSIKTK